MGYYVRTEESNILIPKSSFESACQHLMSIGFLTNTEKMTGRRVENQKVISQWYAWVEMNHLQSCIEKGDLPGVFICFGFSLELDENGDLVSLDYDDKSGDEEHLLQSLCSYFQEGNYIEWRGEEGEHWRTTFSSGKMIFQNPETVWTNNES